VSGVHTHRPFSNLTVYGKMENFLSAIFHVADSEVFSAKIKDIVLSENSLNVATPAATEPETHTLSVEKLYCVFPETCFCACRPKLNNLFSWAKPANFYSCYSPNPYGEI